MDIFDGPEAMSPIRPRRLSTGHAEKTGLAAKHRASEGSTRARAGGDGSDPRESSTAIKLKAALERVQKLEQERIDALYLVENLASKLAWQDRILGRLSEIESKVDSLQGPMDGVQTSDLVKRIAMEVWFEKQRWGLPYKATKWIKRVFRGQSR